MTMANCTEAELLKIRDLHESWLRAQPGVVGTGIGVTGAAEISLKVYSDHMSSATKSAILKRLDGIPVAIEETGQPRLLND